MWMTFGMGVVEDWIPESPKPTNNALIHPKKDTAFVTEIGY